MNILPSPGSEPRTFIFDIDSCISNDEWRKPFEKSGKYRLYHSMSDKDTPAHQGLVRNALASRNAKVFFLTGRPHDRAEATLEWLKRHVVPEGSSNWRLLIRPPALDWMPSPEAKAALLTAHKLHMQRNVTIFDDREDVLNALWRAAHSDVRDTWALGILRPDLKAPIPFQPGSQSLARASSPSAPSDAASAMLGVLDEMRATFEDRNATYGDSWLTFAPFFAAAFPEGVSAEVAARPEFGLFFQVLAKAHRLACSQLRHRDSALDLANYAAMLASLLSPPERKPGEPEAKREAL
jgi:hypothetical protein